MSFITNWVSDKVGGYAKMGLQAGGTMAGNAVGGVGSMVENAGRSAGGSVTGGIAGVGGYINGYGDSIKRSMSSDGPVSSPAKKTAVKPSGAVGNGASQAQKALPQAPKAAGGAGKALSGAGGAAKGAGSTAQKTAPSAPRAAANNKSPPSANTRSATGANNNKPSAPRSSTAQQSNKVQNKTTDGKVRVSAASRPGAVKKSTKPPVQGLDGGKKHDAKDPLGMGGLLDEGKGKK